MTEQDIQKRIKKALVKKQYIFNRLYEDQKAFLAIPWRPRLKRFQTINGKNCFNPFTMRAISYDHWCYLKPIGGKLVLNTFRYSATTGRHILQLKELLTELGVKIDYSINIENNLYHYKFFSRALIWRMTKLGIECQRRRSGKEKNKERQKEINTYAKVYTLLPRAAKITDEQKKSIIKEAIHDEQYRLRELRLKHHPIAQLLKRHGISFIDIKLKNISKVHEVKK